MTTSRTHGECVTHEYGWTAAGDRETRLLTGVVLLALVARLALAVFTESWVFPRRGISRPMFWPFGYEMGQIAASIAMGNGFSWPEWSRHPGPTAWMPPVYPIIMAGVFKIFGTYSTASAMVLELFQAITSALSCVLLFFIGKRLFNAQAGLLAALMLAVYPPALHFAVQKIWSTNLFVFCLFLVILQFFKLAEAPTLKRSILTGLSLGITSLIDPIIFAFWPFALAWLFFKGDGVWRTRLAAVMVVLLTLSATISPWLVRNYLVFDQFAFIKSNFSKELYVNTKQELSIVERQHLEGINEAQRGNFYRKKAFEFIRNHPVQFVRPVAERSILYWTLIGPRGGKGAIFAGISYLALLALAIGGVCLSLRKGRDVQLLLLAVLSLPLPYYLAAVGYLRYRFPIEAILMVFGSHAMYRLYELSKLNRRSSFGVLIRND